MRRHEKFLEHVDAPSPWLDCITTPLCFAAYTIVVVVVATHARYKRGRDWKSFGAEGITNLKEWREDA